MNFNKVDIGIENYSLYLKDQSLLTERMKKGLQCLKDGFDQMVGFIIIGELSYYPYVLESVNNVEESFDKALEAEDIIFKTHPDFTVFEFNGEPKKYGAMVIMDESKLTHVIIPEEVVMNKDESGLDFSCSIVGRSMLMDDATKKEILGYFLPN